MHANKPKSLKIITVDKSPVVAERLGTILREIRNVKFLGNAFNTPAALYLIHKERPDAAILDLNVNEQAPEENCVNLLSLLRERYPLMKIIVLTNFSSPLYHKACMEKGVDYFLDKSNDFDKLPATLEKMHRALNSLSE